MFPAPGGRQAVRKTPGKAYRNPPLWVVDFLVESK